MEPFARNPGVNPGSDPARLEWDTHAVARRLRGPHCRAIHRVDAAAVEGLARRQRWFNAPDPIESAADLTRLVKQELFQPAQAEILLEALDRFWQALPAAV